MKHFPSSLLILLLAALLSSCVSQRKYQDMETSRNRLQIDFDNTRSQLEAAQTESYNLRQDRLNLEKHVKELQADLETANTRYSQLDRTNRDLLERYDRMLEQNRQLLETSSGERKELLAQLSVKQQELDRQEWALRQRENDMESLRTNLQEREQRVKELEAAIAEKDAKLAALRHTINQALLGFSDADLTVREQDGKVYVSLSQNLLFRSGSKAINAAGKEAIGKLAQVLRANPDISITVEGHTDTDGSADLNWDLSVGRATSVVKELTRNGVEPQRIIAAGRGEFFPVAPNTSEQGKAQNRRTEIILTPRLDALFNIINY
jgi:chemotaxis protein MotB